MLVAETLSVNRVRSARDTLGSSIAPIARPYLYADQSIEFALSVLRERTFVPVVHRANAGRLVGMLALED